MGLNREERRKLKRRLRNKGISPELATELLMRRIQEINSPPLTEGERVTLNYDAIVKSPTYAQRPEAYRAFVEENRDREFTVAYDEKHTSGRMVVLAEDPTEPKWLWWSGDLTKTAKESVSDSSAENDGGDQNGSDG